MIRITAHAWDRLSSARPGVTKAEVMQALGESVEVSAGVIAAVTFSARRRSEGRALYFLHAAWSGVFVLSDAAPMLITFLRLGPSQMRLLGVEPAPALPPPEPVPEPVPMTLRQRRAVDCANRLSERSAAGWQIPTGEIWTACPSAPVSAAEVFVGHTSAAGYTRLYQLRRKGPGEWLPSEHEREWWVPGSTLIRRADWDWSECARWLLERAASDARVRGQWNGRISAGMEA